MRQDEFSTIERRAAEEGAIEAGQFLEAIGKTDFAQFTQEEYFEFCRRVVAGYRKACQAGTNEGAPF